MASNVGVLQRGGASRLLIAGAKALAIAFWYDVMDGLAAHGASLGGLSPPEIGPANWREADIAALLDTEPLASRAATRLSGHVGCPR